MALRLCPGPEGTAGPTVPVPHPAHGPGLQFSPPVLSAPAPATPQQGWSPAAHGEPLDLVAPSLHAQLSGDEAIAMDT